MITIRVMMRKEYEGKWKHQVKASRDRIGDERERREKRRLGSVDAKPRAGIKVSLHQTAQEEEESRASVIIINR